MNDVMRSCIWAAAAIAPAALGGFAVIFYMVWRKLSVPLAALSAGVIRLLLAVAGSVIILHFAAISAGWFLAWMGLFYLVTLVAEVYYALLSINRQKE